MPRATRTLQTPPSWSNRAALALLLLGPVVIVPFGLNRFVFGKLAVVAAATAIASGATARGRLGRGPTMLLVAAALVLVVAALSTDMPVVALVGRAPRYEGVITLSVYALAGAAGARLLGPTRQRQDIDFAWRLLVLAGILVGLLALLESTGLRPLSSTSSRPGSLLGNATDQGGFAVLTVGVLGAAALWRPKAPWVIGVVAVGASVVMSGSRAALAGLAICILVLAVFSSSTRRRLISFGALALTGVAAVSVPATSARLLDGSPWSEETISGRAKLWVESASLLVDHLWTGVGPSGFEDAVPGYHSVGYYRTVGVQHPVDSPHNWILQAGCAGGVVLVILALALVGLTAWRGVVGARLESREGSPPVVLGALAGLAGFGVILLTHPTSPGPGCLAAVLGGLILSRPEHTRRAGGRVVTALAGVTGAILAVVLTAGCLAEVALRSAILSIERGEVPTADAHIRFARALRLWDVDIDVIAGHAFAEVAATSGSAAAAEAAEPHLRRAAAALPRHEQTVADLAILDEVRQDYAGAAIRLDGLLRTDPDNPLLLLRRGVISAELNQVGDAETFFLRVTQTDPRSAEPWRNLAILYSREGRDAAARAAEARYRELTAPAN